MKRSVAIFVFMFSCSLLLAQQTGGKRRGPVPSRLSKEEFCQKQQEYLSERMKLTEEEAKAFFPVYFELKEKREAMNREVWKNFRKEKGVKHTEEEYAELVDNTVECQIRTAELEKEYYARFKTIVSARKLFRLQRAEIEFHRDLLRILHGPAGPAPTHQRENGRE
ncbi:MAG: hypothetical protein Q4E55_03650 [Bacteroidales bacterium]|nr:hypothetical protein [Bacteroidales bacterium]